MTPGEINVISGQVVTAAMRVHSALGPGLLESAYQACLVHELRRRGLHVATQVELPVFYEGMRVEVGYRLDILVQDAVIVELKASSKVLPVHEAQLLSYMKLRNHRIGLLINFHVPHLKDGIKRFVNNL